MGSKLIIKNKTKMPDSVVVNIIEEVTSAGKISKQRGMSCYCFINFITIYYLNSLVKYSSNNHLKALPTK